MSDPRHDLRPELGELVIRPVNREDLRQASIRRWLRLMAHRELGPAKLRYRLAAEWCSCHVAVKASVR